MRWGPNLDRTTIKFELENLFIYLFIIYLLIIIFRRIQLLVHILIQID